MGDKRYSLNRSPTTTEAERKKILEVVSRVAPTTQLARDAAGELFTPRPLPEKLPRRVVIQARSETPLLNPA